MCTSSGESSRIFLPGFTRILPILLISFAFIEELQAQCPMPPSQLLESQVSTDGSGVAVAIRDCGEFIIGWQTPQDLSSNFDNDIFAQRFANNGMILGELPLSKNHFSVIGQFLLDARPRG
ncbi:MAG: hypothetical protein ACE5EQ_11710 [Phycisphaerae bacterium]